MILPVIPKKVCASDLRQGIKRNISTLSDRDWLKEKKYKDGFVLDRYLIFKY